MKTYISLALIIVATLPALAKPKAEPLQSYNDFSHNVAASTASLHTQDAVFNRHLHDEFKDFSQHNGPVSLPSYGSGLNSDFKLTHHNYSNEPALVPSEMNPLGSQQLGGNGSLFTPAYSDGPSHFPFVGSGLMLGSDGALHTW